MNELPELSGTPSTPKGLPALASADELRDAEFKGCIKGNAACPMAGALSAGEGPKLLNCLHYPGGPISSAQAARCTHNRPEIKDPRRARLERE
jgi:hypothetical protein